MIKGRQGGQGGQDGRDGQDTNPPVLPTLPVSPVLCQRCGFAVAVSPSGCKNPCPNCGTVYPLGDCSD